MHANEMLRLGQILNMNCKCIYIYIIVYMHRVDHVDFEPLGSLVEHLVKDEKYSTESASPAP